MKLELRDAQARLLSDNFYWLRAPGVKDLNALQSLPPVKLKSSLKLERRGAEQVARVHINNSGSQIAFFSGTNEVTNIYVVAADGSGTRQVTRETSGYNEDPTWSPDGTMIAFWSDRGGDHEIWAMHADGSGLVNVSDTPGADENPSWGR